MGLLVLFLAGLSALGWAGRLDAALSRLLPPGPAHTACYLFLTLLLVRAALLPLHWETSYLLERRFRLLRQGAWSWLCDWGLASLLFAALATAFLTPVVLTLRWWLWLLIPWIVAYI